MEVGEPGSQKLQAEVSWIPTTPAKAILPKPVPIYANGEENQISQRNCLDTNGRQLNWAASAATVTNIAGGNGGTCVQPSMDAISGTKGVSFGYLLALADAASAAQTAATHPGNNEGTNPFIPASNPQFKSNPEANSPSTLLSPPNPCPEQTRINLINGNHQEPQVAPAAICRKTSLQFAPPTPDKAIRKESREVAGMQIHMERNDQAYKEKNVSAPEPDSNGTLHNRELSDPVTESSFAAVSMPSNENDNPDKGGSDGIDLNKTPQQKLRRRKHRPKVISENKPKQTRKPPTPKPVQPKENPTGKRKYVRKKGVNKTTSATPPTEVTGESIEPIMSEPAKKSCRRSLNFDIGEQPRDGNAANRENVTMHHDKGIAVQVEETEVGLAYALNLSMKQALNDYMSLPEVTQAPRKSLSDGNPPMTKQNVNSVKKNSKRKSQALAQAGHETTANAISKTETQLCQNGSNSNSGIFTKGLQMAGSKRKQTATSEHADTSSVNLNGVHFNELQAYDRMHWIQFPNIQKKRRSEKGQTSTAYTTSPATATGVRLATYPQEHASASPCASESSFWISSSEYNAARVPVIFEATERATQDTSQTFGYIFSSSQTGVTRRRSRVPTRIRDFASLTRITCGIQKNHSLRQVGNSSRQTFENVERSQSCIDALGSSLAKKKRTRKKSAPVSSAYSSGNEMHLHKLVLDNHYMALGNSLGAACILSSWNNMLPVDALTEHFRYLDINRDGKYFAYQEQNALVPYNPKNQKHNTLVHKGGGAIIPFEGPFDPIKKQRPRPKVDLDDETNRVWKLLMLDINSHGIDGTDEDKAKWWEEERSVFRGRADSFIARMHLVQGDRRFSCWKGSVVDSVVGVFLTQNVSDHLSSSAFMSLAARFPLRPSSNCKTNHEESTSLVVNEPEVHIVEPEENIKWDGKLLNQSIYDQSSMTIDNIEHSEEKEAVNSNDFSGTTSSVVSLTDESNCKISKSAESNIQEQHSSIISRPTDIITGEVHEKTCYEGVRKESNDIVLSQCSVISSQISDVSIDQNPEKVGSYSDSNSEVEDLSSTAKYNIFDNSTSFSKLLEMASSTMLHEVTSQRSKSTENSKDECIQSISKKHVNQKENFEKSDVVQGSIGVNMVTSSDCTLRLTPNSGPLEVHILDPFKIEAPSSCYSKNKDENDMNKPNSQITEIGSQAAIAHSQSMLSELHLQEQNNPMHKNLLNSCGHTEDLMQKPRELESGDHNYAVRIETREMNAVSIKSKGKRPAKEKEHINWDRLKIQAQAKAGKREKTENTMDSLNWEAVRCADVNEIADAIKERGMNNMLAERIKDFLNRLVEEHGSIDLEWLRDVPPDKAKEYLLSIRGLGLKSVECVRLLTLHHLAFPVDTNVGRIAVRLGWVPLQPLPESLQLHLLELYPILESIQKYLWPRLCKLDQRTLYELHYQMITFGKVFCTKSKPNCNACPMRGECRHFASAFASARLALPGPEQKSIVSTAGNNATDLNSAVTIDPLPLPLPEHMNQSEAVQQTELSTQLEVKSDINICQPIIEEPATPEQECTQISENDIEDAFYDDPNEIPTIKLDMEEFALNLQNYMQENMELQEGDMSKALVALTPEAASIPTPKLKNVSRLRTEHCVYELPDTHPLLEGCDMREPDDPCKYLLAIWTPGETADSIQPPESKCNSQECGQLCNEKECFSCNSIREANSQIVRGTLLIPCRTAMRGSFPLNGTYFQVNEVFADHQSSLDPINVPRSLIWNLNRRTVYFGTSIPSIFKGLTTPEIQQCFWRGYVCVRGFDRGTRAPRPLIARLHFPASKLQKTKDTKDKTNSK